LLDLDLPEELRRGPLLARVVPVLDAALVSIPDLIFRLEDRRVRRRDGRPQRGVVDPVGKGLDLVWK
jgi:hypothetical protein